MTLYVQLAADGSVDRYPFSLTDLRRANPGTSFPDQISDATAAAFGCYPVQPTDPPADDPTQNLERTAVRRGDGWVEEWISTPATAEEIAERTAGKSAAVREQRNALLAACDWTQVPDAYSAKIDIGAWAAYRQQLRNVPERPGFPWEVEWPAPPESTPMPICDYHAFYAALLVSPAYVAIRSRAVSNSAVLTACVEFIAAIGDAKSGRPNTPAIQACVDLLCAAAQFTAGELQALAEVMAVGGLDQVYVLPGAASLPPA